MAKDEMAKDGATLSHRRRHAVENTKLRFGFQLFGFQVFGFQVFGFAFQPADARGVADRQYSLGSINPIRPSRRGECQSDPVAGGHEFRKETIGLAPSRRRRMGPLAWCCYTRAPPRRPDGSNHLRASSRG
jgi:hypothetical protein